jgi:hypothetical protein
MSDALPRPFARQMRDAMAVWFTLVILPCAAGGPIGDFVRWFVEATTDG